VITKTIVQSNKDLLASSQVQNQQSLVAVEKWVQNIPEILVKKTKLDLQALPEVQS
jgi:hypothetical protein